MASVDKTSPIPVLDDVAAGQGDAAVSSAQPCDEEEADLRCGYRTWRPGCLQRFNTPRFLLASVCWFTFVQGFVVNGINNVNTATIERRFDLQSSSVAWISSSYDICAGFMALILGYIGTFSHIGRILTIGAALMGTGSFVMFLPHLLAGPYTLGQEASKMCNPYGNGTDLCDEEQSGTSIYLSLFILGQVLHGFGGASVYTLAPAYLDGNTKMKNTPLYLGLMLSFAAFGPAMGYICGGLFLTIYVDLGRRVDSGDIDMSPGDPGWVGAWWIGFLVSSIGGFSVAMIFACYAKELPVAKIYRLERKTQSHKGAGEKETAAEGFGRSWKDVFYSVKLILTNLPFIFLTVAGIVESGAVVAFATFFPKIMQFQFGMSAGVGAMVAGALVVPGAAGGQILGGLIPRWFKLKIRGLMVQNVVCAVIGLALTFCLLMNCDTAGIAGVNMSYFNFTPGTDSVDLVDSCNAACNCSTHSYEPLCGVDGAEYFSPCHAGCLSSGESSDGKQVYYDCGCIDSANSTQSFQATRGVCSTDCSTLGLFMPLFFFLILVTFVSNTSAQSATIRCVPDKERSFACGIQSTLVRYLGNVPGPIIIGNIFDDSCLVWQENCDETGACWIYEANDLARGIVQVGVIVKLISTIGFTLALVFYRAPPPEMTTDPVDLTNSKKQDSFVVYDNATLSRNYKGGENAAFYSETVRKPVELTEINHL